MVEKIDYSIIIRTTGQAGEKYQKLLNSIEKLIPKPKEIIVVLPIGNEKPKDVLGWETFYFTKKGMVSQRLYGINQCKTKYALICDDDVSFESNFVSKLYQPIYEKKCDLSAGPLIEFFPRKGINSFISAIFTIAVPTIFHKSKYCHILRGSGYSYNRKIDCNQCKYYETDSLPWTCFFGDIDKIKSIKLEDERWLDMHGYAALDDQTMFYKGKLLGIKTCVVSDAIYQHNDAKTSSRGINDIVSYSLSFNRIVFWYRFLYLMQSNGLKKVITLSCFAYKIVLMKLFYFIKLKLKRMTISEYCSFNSGFTDGYKYISSKEFLMLPSIKNKEKIIEV
ncbi:glycosyltransferase [uncultured Thomasclavelia sp.]|uniref:glycosyltransferase n=1 Tax=uncultured Thomasclavelia sp. TaxID=3025759 RepID=UPI00280AE08B|nr:glycosyltransferase [uncultured Thomasclavelia sp.]